MHNAILMGDLSENVRYQVVLCPLYNVLCLDTNGGI